ncbi:MAG: DNA primase [Sedimentisphaerales bacterium]|nr:DNA primase [Sedimentisphaerales bacterium]
MSTFFDDNHIRQILQAVNIVEVVGNYVALKRHGREMLGLCPFHNDTRPSFNVSESKQIFKCFACGVGGDVIKFIMLREQMTFPEAVRFLAERAGVKLPERKTKNSPDSAVDRNELEKLNRWAARFFRSQYDKTETGRIAREYVNDRQINEETARRFGLGWTPEGWDNLTKAAQEAGKPLDELALLGLLIKKDQGGFYDRFRQRLMFPVIDALGRVIAFGGRTLADDPAKYVNSPESPLFNKSRTLYGLHAAKDSIIKERTAVIVEGYTDCLMAHQYELTNVVATLGTALTREHAQLLSRYADKIILVFDSDTAGQKAADRAIEVFFSQQTEVKLVTLPAGLDPCDFLKQHGDNGKEAFEDVVNNATEAMEYKWQMLQNTLEQADSVKGHQRAADEYLRMIAEMAAKENIDSISQGLVLNRVAKLLGVPSNEVYQRINRRRRWQKNTTEGTQPGQQIILDGRVKAEQEVLEILLNRQDLFEKVRQIIPNAEDITEPILQQIARRLWVCLEKSDDVPLAEILAGCESPQLCEKILNLAERGEIRGNYEVILEGALGNIERIRRQQANQELRGVFSDAQKRYGKEAHNAIMLEIQAKHEPDAKRYPTIIR